MPGYPVRKISAAILAIRGALEGDKHANGQ
jgi:hypothetical protein